MIPPCLQVKAAFLAGQIIFFVNVPILDGRITNPECTLWLFNIAMENHHL